MTEYRVQGRTNKEVWVYYDDGNAGKVATTPNPITAALIARLLNENIGKESQA